MFPKVTGGLIDATNGWTLRVVAREYDNNDKGHKQFQEEAAVLGDHGYFPQTQSEEGGHVHAGRILLTGGLSVFAGQSVIRSTGMINATFVKADAVNPPPPTPRIEPDPIAQLRQLAELRDAGVITAQDFEVKKAEILARI